MTYQKSEPQLKEKQLFSLSNDVYKFHLNRGFRDELKALSFVETLFIVALIFATSTFVALDVSTDIQQQSTVLHISIDIIFGIATVLCVVLLWARLGGNRILLANELKITANEKSVATEQAHFWKLRAEQLREGISTEIDLRMDDWGFSAAEKEIGLLLLKGCPLREVADLRGTSERTVRSQSLAIYEKAKVSGRAELSAYFLEDFLDRKTEVIQ